MKNFYQLLAGGLLATLLNAAPLPSVAQSSGEGYISAFTDREIQILEQEYLIDHPGEPIYRDEKSGRLIRTYNTWRYHGVRKRGGIGKNRWLVIELSTDNFGNQYFLDTRTLRYRGNTSVGDGSISVKFVAKVVYNNAEAHNGVAIRDVLINAYCPRSTVYRDIWPPISSTQLSIGIVRYIDYDSNGDFVGRYEISETATRAPKSKMEAYDAQQACQIADRLPGHLKLLQRGLDRKTLHEPSTYD